MKSSELRTFLSNLGRRPVGKLVQVPLKEEGKELFADVYNDRAYSYFLIDRKAKRIKEGHIFTRNKRKAFGVYSEHALNP